MNNMSNVSFRIETDVKNKADELFSELGISMTTALNIFIRQSIREGGIPFNINVNANKFNNETEEALLEARKISKDSNTKAYSVEEALKELKK